MHRSVWRGGLDRGRGHERPISGRGSGPWARNSRFGGEQFPGTGSLLFPCPWVHADGWQRKAFAVWVGCVVIKQAEGRSR